MDHKTGQNYSTKCALVQTYLWQSQIFFGWKWAQSPNFFFFLEKCSKFLPHLYLGTGLDRAGSRVTAWPSSTSLPRPWGGHAELRRAQQGLCQLHPLPGRASRGEAVWIRSSSVLHLIQDAKWSCWRLNSVPLLWNFYGQSKDSVLRKKQFIYRHSAFSTLSLKRPLPSFASWKDGYENVLCQEW